MYQVLVPIDGNEARARSQAEYALTLAERASDAAVTVLYVVPPDALETDAGVDFTEIGAAVTAAEYLEEHDVSVDRRVEGGKTIAEEILDVADDVDADELVLGGRKRSGVARVLLGSTVHDVFVSTERPVTITGREMSIERGSRRLVLPVDASAERVSHQVDYVTSFPDAPEDVEVTVLYVFPEQDYKGAPPHEFEDVDAAVETADALEDAGIDTERVAVGGGVARTIIDEAEERDATGIVMGGRKRSGVQKVLLGSITQDVMLSADRPVTLTG
ncbi:universal stress protein [Halobellus rubicundus]|uniref:Universal stress protein n=1 Tax=Halobellus rubicundus TaxID=2996466 RepID=A0ABD5MI60_9EURY